MVNDDENTIAAIATIPHLSRTASTLNTHRFARRAVNRPIGCQLFVNLFDDRVGHFRRQRSAFVVFEHDRSSVQASVYKTRAVPAGGRVSPPYRKDPRFNNLHIAVGWTGVAVPHLRRQTHHNFRNGRRRPIQRRRSQLANRCSPLRPCGRPNAESTPRYQPTVLRRRPGGEVLGNGRLQAFDVEPS